MSQNDVKVSKSEQLFVVKKDTVLFSVLAFFNKNEH